MGAQVCCYGFQLSSVTRYTHTHTCTWAYCDKVLILCEGYGRENPWGIVDIDDCCGCAKYLVMFLSLSVFTRNKSWLEAIPRYFFEFGFEQVSFGSAGGYTILEALAFEDVIKAGASLYRVSTEPLHCI